MNTNWQFLSLHRYYIYSNRLKEYFDFTVTNYKCDEEAPLQAAMRFTISDPMMFMFYWYASLYVVIEGWQELCLSDPEIDALLASPNVQLLKRFRNGLFHYQKNYGDNRFTELLRPGEDVVPWVRDLHGKIGAYFLRELSTKLQQ